MGKKQEIEKLKSLTVEERAKQVEKNLSCSIFIIVFLCGLVIGLYYWFGNSFLFDYDSVSPFWGFVIFILIDIVMLLIVACIGSSYWHEYNDIIAQANKEILEIIKNGNGSEQDLFRMKKDYIERKIGKETLTQDEFEWHSEHYCWGCGKEQIAEPKPYIVTKNRTVSWKEGGFRYTKTYSESGMILICPECYARLSRADEISAKNGNISKVIMIILYVIIAVGTLVYVLIHEIQSSDSSMFFAIFLSLFATAMSLGLAFTLGQIILLPLTALLSIPFMNSNLNNDTKWKFNEIPRIKKFMSKDLPHNR